LVTKKWRCRVCGYVHEGDAPPEVCPVCGVGASEFVMVQEEREQAGPSPAPAGQKRWKCTVCDYIHTGDGPPKACPLCGVGAEFFVLLTEDIQILTPEAVSRANEGTTRSALFKVSYGLYVLTSASGGRINGQCVNTVAQLTDTPLTMAICLNKRNLTHEFVMDSGVFAVSVLRQEDIEMVRRFGFQSGRAMDKFAGIEYVAGKNGCPILKNCVAYLEGTVLPDKIIDVGTHSLFIAAVTAGRVVSAAEPLTYSYYQENKGKKRI